MSYVQELVNQICQARRDIETARANCVKNPADADKLTELGRLLVEYTLAYTTIFNAKEKINEAISKLKGALLINPTKHDALYWLGKACILHGLAMPHLDEAKGHFDKAHDCFQKAVDEDPSNELYCKALEDTAKAPEMYMEKHEGRLDLLAAEKSFKEKSSDLKSNIFGWSSILAIGIVALVGMVKSHIRPPPPS